MNKLIISLLAFTISIAAWANPSGKYHLSKAHVHMVDILGNEKTFAAGVDTIFKPGYGKLRPNCAVTANPTGTISLYNLIGEEVTFNCRYDEATKKLTVPIQSVSVNYEGQAIDVVVCGGFEGYKDAKELIKYLDSNTLMVPSNTLEAVLVYDEASNTLTLGTPLLAYTPQTIFGTEFRFALACVSEITLQKITLEANADQRTLQDLKDKVKNAASDYSDYVNQAECDALLKTIDDWSWKINRALSKSLNEGSTYKTPWTAAELATLEKSIDDFVQRLVDAKEADGLSNEEIDSLVAVDNMVLMDLETRLYYIHQNYEEYLDMQMYNTLCQILYELFNRLENARNEAYETHQYTTPWDNGEILDIEMAINNLEKNAQEKESEQNGISNIEADPETEAIYYDLNGRLVKNPTSGTLYIRVLGGKAQKVII